MIEKENPEWRDLWPDITGENLDSRRSLPSAPIGGWNDDVDDDACA